MQLDRNFFVENAITHKIMNIFTYSKLHCINIHNGNNSNEYCNNRNTSFENIYILKNDNKCIKTD